MNPINYDYIESFINNLVPEHTGALKEIEQLALSNEIPIVRKEVAAFLELMVKIKKPVSVLELGTAIGYSSILIALSSSNIKQIITIEKDEEVLKVARENINKFKLDKIISIKQGDCLEVLKNLQGKFDFIFMDAGKAHYNHYLPYCLKLLNEDGMIFADNVLFRGMVASKALVERRKITIVKRMKEFIRLITTDNNLVTSVLPIGDGVSITIRR